MHSAPRTTSMRLLPTILMAFALLSAGCAANSPDGGASSMTDAPAIETGTAPPPPDMALPTPATDAAGQPLIEQPETATDAGASGVVDYACTTDADCAVKDVGSCCGYSPACVNVDSPTFPEQVKAECAKNDLQSTCGFRDIEGCACVAGRCEAGPAASGEAVR